MRRPAGPRIPTIRAIALFIAICISAAADAEDTSPSTMALGFIDSALSEGRYKAAQDLLVRAKARSDNAELRLREAELLLATGATDKAIAQFTALQADPTVAARAHVAHGVALLRLGRAQDAEAALAQGVALDPMLERGWTALGVLADRRRDWPKAEASYTRALLASPQSAVAHNNRGYSRLLQGRHAEAEADLALAVRLDPKLDAAATNLRFAKAMQGRYTEAFADSTKERLAQDLNTVGFAAMARGEYALAETYFSRALELNGQYDKTAAANLAYLATLAPPKSVIAPE